VELALKRIEPEAKVKNLDALELTNKTFRRLYGQAYLDLVNRAPHVLGYLYDLLDRPRGPKQKSDRLRVLVERLNLRSIRKLIKSEPWEVIINPVPGQEARNSDFLLENGAAIKINNVATLPYKLNKLLGDEARLRQIKQDSVRLGRPQAAFDVAKIALRLTRSGSHMNESNV
jgi:hypothetical protein